MLMNEIASAEDTLELYKLINDSVWAALQKQQTEEKERKAAAQRAAAAKRSVRKPTAAATKKPPAPAAPPPKPLPVQPQVKSAVQPQAQQLTKTVAVAAPSYEDALRLGLQQRQPFVQRNAKYAG